MNKNTAIIAIDFDGTIVTHDYPKIGTDLLYAKEIIKALIDEGHKVFIYTMRDGDELEDVVKYCETNELNVCGFNRSPAQFSKSPKQYAHVYIDDAALGCPLDNDLEISNRPFVNWYAVGRKLVAEGFLPYTKYHEIITS